MSTDQPDMSTHQHNVPDAARSTPPDPVVRIADAVEPARDVMLIPDSGVPLVPNIGVIGGRDAVLVVDTGLGEANAQAVLDYATRYAGSRRIYLTTTHFHPEHASGAAAFAGHATYLVNQAQAEEAADKAAAWLRMFGTLGPHVAAHTESATVAIPDVLYDHDHDLDLGGRVVHLHGTGRAHTRGDQIVVVPDVGVMFTGDLVEAGQFPVFPWLPGHDTDVSGQRWLTVMRALIARTPNIVIPGHGPVGDIAVLHTVTVTDYLQLVCNHTRQGQKAGLHRDAIVEQTTAAAIDAYPQWIGREWIASAIDSMLLDLTT